jgi:hypothetical protein
VTNFRIVKLQFQLDSSHDKHYIDSSVVTTLHRVLCFRSSRTGGSTSKLHKNVSLLPVLLLPTVPRWVQCPNFDTKHPVQTMGTNLFLTTSQQSYSMIMWVNLCYKNELKAVRTILERGCCLVYTDTQKVFLMPHHWH